ncbi:MAG: sulfate adenylyltransferase subunit CysN [Proteobacteria bacterium]|nr:sulfate adenylyltransferase subunit CysN [Pseudomonadota bacterium]
MTASTRPLLQAQIDRDLLRLLTCGSVDDGKSTLIGRLLHDSGQLFEDQLEALKRDSARLGHAGDALDLSLLTDGLKAEREQGITIDVAFRYFSTSRRKFIIADTPGHEQFTANMATGASVCDLAVVLVDARHGLLDQSRRHTTIVALLGIKHIVVAVNKMDLVGWDRATFESIRTDFARFAAPLGVPDLHFIPLSALHGDNVVRRSTAAPWFAGRPLLELLETIHVASDRNFVDFRFPVQRVVRPDDSFRGYAGTVASGQVQVGDEVTALPCGRRTRVSSIVTYDGDRDEAMAGDAVTLTLADPIDVSRGDMLCHTLNQPLGEREIEAQVIWFDDEALTRGSSWRLKHTTRAVTATITDLVGRTDITTGNVMATDALERNGIGTCVLTLNQPVFYDPYRMNRSTGAFILIHPRTNATAGAGLIVARHPRAHLTPDPQVLVGPAMPEVSPEMHARALRQTPFTIWLTGLPKSGKLPIAYRLEKRLHDVGLHTCVLPAKHMRHGISADLTFSADDRGVNARRLAEIARIVNDAGLIAICTSVSPYRADRERARTVIGAHRFIEAWCSAPAEACEARDANDLYKRARLGELRAFTGVSAPYEMPESADVTLPIHEETLDALVDRLVAVIAARGLYP